MSNDIVFKCYYNKSLNMSPGKIASQVGHAVSRLSLQIQASPSRIIVLEARTAKLDKMFNDAKLCTNTVVQRDLGLTEVAAGAVTAIAFAEYPNTPDLL
jgi:peptidyl-tRNA hydrolase